MRAAERQDPRLRNARRSASRRVDRQLADGDYPLEILIGERPGGVFYTCLMMQKEGAKYQTRDGMPRFPLFRVADVSAQGHKKDTPSFATAGPVWKAVVKRTTLPLLPQ